MDTFSVALSWSDRFLSSVQDMEKQVKEFATGLEQLVDRFISGELGNEIGKNMDKHMTGFIHHFEDGYSKFEQAKPQLAVACRVCLAVPQVLMFQVAR